MKKVSFYILTATVFDSTVVQANNSLNELI
jgi:hypothetical protein